MFDMQQVGSRISKLRKSIGITQTGLADRLGISFQAVSNWERGVSMPDISKLKELSEIFGVTVDEILGGGTHSELVRELIEKQPVRKATREEIEEIAPILHEAQVETLLNGSDRCEADIDMVASLAPYLSQAYIDRYALSLLNKYNTFRAIGRIAPFVSTSVLEEKAAELVKRSGSLDVLEPVMPFLSSELLDRLADAFYEKTAACLLCRRFSPLSAPQNATRSQNWLIGSTGRLAPHNLRRSPARRH